MTTSQSNLRPMDAPKGLPQEAQDPIDELVPYISKDAPLDLVSRLRSLTQGNRTDSLANAFPSAEQFALYEHTFPGAADRVLRLAEREQALSNQRIGLQRRHMNAALAVSLGLIGMAGFGMWQLYGFVTVGLFGIGGLATMLLYELISKKTGRQPADEA